MNAITPPALATADTSDMTSIGIGQTVFSRIARGMIARGWSVFPQDRYLRKPAVSHGRTICPVSDHHVNEHPVADPVLREWELQCSTANVACVFGTWAPGMFAVDIDVLDPALAEQVSDLAEHHLGSTGFVRVGRAPKVAMLYRTGADDLVANVSRRFADEDGKDSGDAVEILGAGKTLTLHGIHHRTGRYYTWCGKRTPLLDRPEEVPEVSAEQVADFLAACESLRPFVAASRFDAATWHPADGAAGVAVARIERGSDGLLTDGRKAYASKLTWETVRLHGEEILAAGDDEAAVAEIRSAVAAAVLEELAANVEIGRGEWARGAAERRVRADVGRLVEKVRRGTVKPKGPRGPGGGGGASKPRIELKVAAIAEAVDAAEVALAAAGRGVYQRGGEVVQVGEIAMPGRGGDVSVQRIFPVSETALLEHVSESAEFVAWRKSRKKDAEPEQVVVDCPPWVARHMAARAGRRALSVLDGVIEAPTLRQDGSVLECEGYDEASGLLVDLRGVAFPPVPEAPSRADAETALGKLKALIATFPFVSDADRSVQLALMLTACVRRSLPMAPMFALNAHVPGTGKGKLASIATALMTGKPAGLVNQAEDGDKKEDEKRLAAELIGGAQYLVIDNCMYPVGGGMLNTLLTEATVKPRVLGLSKNVELRTNVLCVATGNNLTFVGDMDRRVMMATIDAGCERPHERRFATDPVQQAIRDRAELVTAALTVIRAFLAAGSPMADLPVFGSYEQWSAWVRGPLVWLGETDPYETLEAVRATNPRLDELGAVMLNWRSCFGDRRVTTSDLVKAAVEQQPVEQGSFRLEFVRPDLREALLAVADTGGNINARRLGRWIVAHAGRPVAGNKIVKLGAGHAGLQTFSMELSAEAADEWKATLALWAQPSVAARDAARGAQEIESEAVDAFDGDTERADLWCRSNLPSLGGMSPRDTAGTPDGLARVRLLLGDVARREGGRVSAGMATLRRAAGVH